MSHSITNNFETIKSEFEKLSTIELIAINHDIQRLEETTENALMYFIQQLFIKHKIMIDEINDIMWPLCDVITTRFLETKKQSSASLAMCMN